MYFQMGKKTFFQDSFGGPKQSQSPEPWGYGIGTMAAYCSCAFGPGSVWYTDGVNVSHDNSTENSAHPLRDGEYRLENISLLKVHLISVLQWVQAFSYRDASVKKKVPSPMGCTRKHTRDCISFRQIIDHWVHLTLHFLLIMWFGKLDLYLLQHCCNWGNSA